MGALTLVVIEKLFVNYCSCHQLTILSQQFKVNSVLAIINLMLYIFKMWLNAILAMLVVGLCLTGVSELPLNCM